MRKRLASRAIATGALLALGACSTHGSSFLAPHGMVANAERSWFFVILLLMGIVVVPALVLAPLFAWRYRYGAKKVAYKPEWSSSWRLELLIWGVPVAIVSALGWLVFTPEVRFDPYRALPSNGPPLRIEVVALNWKWLFIYPSERIATVGEVAVPVGRDVEFDLTSDRTMQSFSIPTLGSQIYAMAGMVSKLHLEASTVGDFMGQNTQFNGVGFQNDRFSVLAMTQAEFGSWVTKVRSSPLKLDRTTYAVLYQDSTEDEAREALRLTTGDAGMIPLSSAPPDLFGSIVAKYRGTAPGLPPA